MSDHLGLKIFSDVCSHYKLFARLINVQTTQCKTFVTGGPHATMNYVYDIDIRDEESFAHDLAMLRETKIPMMLLCEANTSEKMDYLFKSENLTIIGSAQSKFLPLSHFCYTPSPMISIKEVKTDEMMTTWRQVAATGFDYPFGCDEALFKDYISSAPHDSVKLFVAYVDGKAVGQSMLVLCEDASANMWSSVLPEYRKQGILTEMIKYRNSIAHLHGHTQSVVQCMPSSAPVYDKLGYMNAEKFNIYSL
ncbi:MAG: GNAT family N-acetyltransferase [Gammaproteobacteria bacterium]